MRGDGPPFGRSGTAMGAWHRPKETIAVMAVRSRCTPLDAGADSCCSVASGRSSLNPMDRVDPVSPIDGSNHEDEKPGLGCDTPWSTW